MKFLVLTLLSISIPTIHGECTTLCHDGDTGFDSEIDDGKLNEFVNSGGDYDGPELTCALQKTIVPNYPNELCSMAHALNFGFCGCEEPTPDMCTTGYDGALIDLDKMVPDELNLGFPSSCRDLVVGSGFPDASDDGENSYEPFSGVCGLVRGVCGNGLTCEICPGGLANPDNPFEDPDGDDDEGSGEDDDGSGEDDHGNDDGNDDHHHHDSHDDEGSDEDDDGNDDGNDDGYFPGTCADAHAFVLGLAHTPETCNDFTELFASAGCLCNGGSKSAKSSKHAKAGKNSKAPKGSKAPKDSKGTKSTKGSTGTKKPKGSKGTKEPKGSKGTKSAKSAKLSKSPKSTKNLR